MLGIRHRNLSYLIHQLKFTSLIERLGFTVYGLVKDNIRFGVGGLADFGNG